MSCFFGFHSYKPRGSTVPCRPGRIWQGVADLPAMSELDRTEPVDWEDVYRIWAYECTQSVSETARRCNIPRRTVAYHHQVERWDYRYTVDHFGLSEGDVT